MKKVFVAGVLGVMLTVSGTSAKVIGRINGYPVTEKEANKFLKVVTKGKLKYHQLRPKDKKDVIKRIAVDALLIGMAKKETPLLERNQVLVNYWLTKKIKKIKVSDAEVRKAYDSNKRLFKDPRGKPLPFGKVKEMIAVSIKQKKYVARLVDSAKITMGNTVIKAPKRGASSGKKKSGRTSANGKTKIYIVKSGNTLSGIAHKYHITIAELRALNGMKETDTLKIGQKLKIPANQ